MNKNKTSNPTSTTPADEVAARIAGRSLADRQATYAEEVRRLLDAGLAVMRERGTESRPRVADIVAAAGLSNDAFYRHFSSKDALVEAILEDGAQRLVGYVTHQMDKHDDPAERIRTWIEGVLSQAADPTIASTTLAVVWNAGALHGDDDGARSLTTGPLVEPLRRAVADAGCPAPERHAALVAHAVMGTMTDWLWQRSRPGPADVEEVVTFCLGAVGVAAER